jgi:hypothetical protein
MFQLSNTTDARWIDLARGVRVLAKPATTAVIAAMQAAAQRRARELTNGETVDEHLRQGIAFQTAVQALARYSVQDWSGVAGPDGKPLPCTPEGLDALMSHDEMAVAFWRAQIEPLEERAAEGNA